jgi:hypothetical protein
MSKGSSPRPYSVTAEDFSNRWNAIFGKEKSDDVNFQKETSGPDGSIEAIVEQARGHDSSGDRTLLANNESSQSPSKA